ncbi:MAG: ATP-binding protein [Lachnospiraceae bacterium]|nr:ATP-binding protein [Lachnospiraceae bacterium]
MILSEEQYNGILREYEEKRRKARQLREERRAEVEAAVPAFSELDAMMSDVALGYAKGFENDLNGAGTGDAVRKFRDIAEKRKSLLVSGGFPPDYLESVYECPLCDDTGFVDGKKCRCYLERESGLLSETLYLNSHIRALSGKTDFDMLREDLYTDDNSGDSLKRFRGARDAALNFASTFPDTQKNLLFMGSVGTGKTTLSVCIAKKLIERGFSVIYFSSVSLFELLGRVSFDNEKRSERDRVLSDIYNCDLLVIDDLGTELLNSFVEEQLFSIINERSLRDRRMVISTNQDTKDLQRVYGDRIFSRIISEFVILKLTGSDIRFKLVMNRKEPDTV